MEIKRIPMRDGYGEALLEMCNEDKNLMVLDADVSKSTRTNWIKDKFPEKFMNMGISEQDMVCTAAGLALGGIPTYVSTYCVFLCGRAWDEIRTTVCYNDLNVKFGGAHAGISVGPDGATHQALEDIALMRVLPKMTVIAPCDAEETRKATLAAYDIDGPVFIRFGREAVPLITDKESPFEVGKANVMRDVNDVVIFAIGALVYEAMEAAKQLEKENISAAVVNMHTIKPIDKECIRKYAEKTGAIVTAEEHQIYGGMGSAVAEVTAACCPTPIEHVAMLDSFGESGQPEELMKKYGLSAEGIVTAVRKVLERKNNEDFRR